MKGRHPSPIILHPGTQLQLRNCQRHDVVPVAWLSRVVRRAVRQRRLRDHGKLVVSFIDARTMRRLNWRFLRHRGLTDVLSFRYVDEPIAGEILVSPAFARRYAKQHGLPYRQELARYVVHGLLHWQGFKDRTARQQRRMRRMEDQLLVTCVK